MKNTTGTKMLIFSFAFAAMSYFMASPTDTEMVDLPLEPETTSGEQVLTDEQMISLATEEMRYAIATFNTPVKSGLFGWVGNSKKPLELGKTYPVWCYLSALLNLGEHGHLVEQLGKKLRLPNEDADKAMAFRWADDLSVCGQPSVLYAFTNYLAECARNNPDLMDSVMQDRIVKSVILGLTSVMCVSRRIDQKTGIQEKIGALVKSYASILTTIDIGPDSFKFAQNTIIKNMEYWQNVPSSWLDAVTVDSNNRPVFGKENLAIVDMTQSEFMSNSASVWSEDDLQSAFRSVRSNLSSWLSEK